MCPDCVLQCSVQNRGPARFNEAESSGTLAQGVQSQAITNSPQPLLLLALVNSNLCQGIVYLYRGQNSDKCGHLYSYMPKLIVGVLV